MIGRSKNTLLSLVGMSKGLRRNRLHQRAGAFLEDSRDIVKLTDDIQGENEYFNMCPLYIA